MAPVWQNLDPRSFCFFSLSLSLLYLPADVSIKTNSNFPGHYPSIPLYLYLWHETCNRLPTSRAPNSAPIPSTVAVAAAVAAAIATTQGWVVDARRPRS